MKKTFLISSVIVALAFLTTACSNSTNIKENNTNINDMKTASSSSGRLDGVRMPDFGQPDRAPDMVGIVKSIIGNEVTVLKIERPNGGQGSATSTEQRRSLNLSGATGVPGSGGGLVGGMRGSTGGTVDRAQMLENIKKQSTGEAKIVIPVGIKMLTSGVVDAAAQPKMNEATLADVKQDKMLNIWLNQDVKDQSVAEFVLVR